MESGQASAQSGGGAEEPDFGSSRPAGKFLTLCVGDDETCRTQLLLLSPQLSWGLQAIQIMPILGAQSSVMDESQMTLPLLF